jgi:predicted HicB family RNase H-like nuclease
MRDVLKYKDFLATVHYSADDDIFFGKIEGINDLVTFEGSTTKELRNAFKEAVDDYIELCKEHKREILKSYKGSFNIRISPDLHRKISEAALSRGLSLNQIVQKALELMVEGPNA